MILSDDCVWLCVTLGTSDCVQQCHILVSWSPNASGCGDSQTDCVCGCVGLYITAYTCLSGTRGTLGTLPGMAGRPGGYPGAGQAGSEVRRAESLASPTQPYQAGRQMEKMFTPGTGRWPPHQGLLCAQKTSSSGISSSWAGSGFWVAGSWIQLVSAPAEG